MYVGIRRFPTRKQFYFAQSNMCHSAAKFDLERQRNAFAAQCIY